MRSFAIALFAAVITTVNAHAYVETVTIDGQQYSGWLPFTDPWAYPLPSRIVRKVPSDAPILDPYTPDLNCNVGGNDPAGLTADVNAGAQITFKWNRWPDEHKGPFVIHMADCGSSCDTFQSSSARWFAIDQRTFENGRWYNDIFIENGASFTTTVPASLRPGNYLIRMQLTALHSVGAPQFYPSCAQIRVSGSGNGYPAESELTHSVSELVAGYETIDIWANPGMSYMAVPGPAVAAFVHNNPPPSLTADPSTTQTLGGTLPTSTHSGSLCRRSGRRPRRLQPNRGIDSVVRNLHGIHGVAARSKRHHEFTY